MLRRAATLVDAGCLTGRLIGELVAAHGRTFTKTDHQHANLNNCGNKSWRASGSIPRTTVQGFADFSNC